VINLLLEDLLALSTLTISTCDPAGNPHAAPVYFAAGDELHLYFFSDPESQHGQDFLHDHRAAVAFYPECREWEEIRGVQMKGEVQTVKPGDQWEYAWKVFRAKFPFVTDLQELVAQNQLYVFVPHWVRLVDNRIGFGYKKEWILA
jgi:uncharacterized protein YhbP (UPF0306 family)